MSDSGQPTPAPASQNPPASGDVPTWLIVTALVLMVAGGGLVAFVLLRGTHASATTPSYPSAWDPRIAPYATIAEKERGLAFLHPVTVRFLPAKTFEKDLRGDASKLDTAGRKKLKQETGMLRAFGLIHGDVDLFGAISDFRGSGTLAYYSFDDHRITVRGTEITAAVRSTLVHELTHALQDQHFDVGARLEKVGKAARKDSSTARDRLLDALTEGDAERVETLYRASLSPEDRAALDASRRAEGDQASEQLKQVPTIVVTLMTSNYTLGQALVQAVAQHGGNSAVDELFRDTPEHEAALLDPFQVLSGDTGSRAVDQPALEDGEKRFDSGELGAITWYLMLAERLPLPYALETVDGWGGDAYVAFDRNGTSCVRAAYTGDRAPDTTRMLDALRRWISAAPGSTATVSTNGSVLTFESCDPGSEAKTGKDNSDDAVTLDTVRSYLGLALLRAGVTQNVARCVAGRLIDAYPVSQLVDPTFGAKDPRVRAKVQQLVVSCRS